MRKLIGDTELYPYWKNVVFRKFFKHHMHAFKKALSKINTFLTIDGYVNKGSPIDKTLIIVPDGLLNQWKNEFKTSCPSLKVMVIDKEENEKKLKDCDNKLNTLQADLEDEYKTEENQENHNVPIKFEGVVKRTTEKMENQSWYCVSFLQEENNGSNS
jgi:SNF2 family DNA or RNA helicase